ncbi:SirB1 family protein [Roseateles sp. BYS180W]|uniref:SirB1 family protein n=1 Tax=Roseateles rivi TaxID=3299028 RepID=A0ABW7FYW7_9BURK
MSKSQHWTIPTALEYFASLVADDEGLNLTEAAIALAQDEYPQLDVQQVMAEIDALGLRLRQRLPDDAPPQHRLHMLCGFFHGDLGFTGNVNDYYAPDNSFVHRVLVTRRGLPITLAALFMELGSQLQLRLHGVGFPGHFLMKLRLPQGEVVLDPLSGRSLARHELEERLLHTTGDCSTPALEQALASVSARQMVARMLRNLREVYSHSGDAHRLLMVQQRLVILLPDDPRERRERGYVLELLGQREAALQDLQHYVRSCPAAPDCQRVEAVLARLGSGPTLH